MRLARRLRPDDLWLPEERATVASARGWTWDLSPLERGECAQVIRASDAPDTDLDTATLRRLGEGLEDRAIIDEMIRGFSHDALLDGGSLLCAPHVGALRLLAQAEAKLAKNVQKGWASEWTQLPCWPVRACPYSVVDESERAGAPKFRLTNDLSWPHPGMVEGVMSLNDAMDRTLWPEVRMLHVREVAEAAAILQSSGAPVRVWSLDAEAYYRKVGKRPDEVVHQAMVTPGGKWQVDTRAQFGDAAVAVKAGRMSNFIARVAKQRLRAFDARHPPVDWRVQQWVAERRAAGLSGALHSFGLYCDDGLGSSVADMVVDQGGEWVCRADEHFAIARAVLTEFGHVSAPDKEQPPSLRMTALGVVLDVDSGRMWLTPDKAERYAARAEAAAACRTMEVGALREVMGRLTFAAMLYPRGRTHLQHGFRALRARFRLEGGRVSVGVAARASFLWWARELRREDHTGVPLASRAAASLR